MKKKLCGLLAGCVLATRLTAIEVVNNEKSKLDINGSFQLMGSVQGLSDPIQDDVRSYMFLKQARVYMPGQHEDVKFRVEFGLGGEEDVSSTNVSVSLLDMYADFPLFFGTRFRVGQELVPFGRERVVYERDLQFTGRSMNNTAFTLGRDVGGIAYGNAGIFTAALGLFAGGGRDVPERYLPEKLGSPMMVAKVGINSGADQDILTLTQAAQSVEKPVFAFYLSGMYQKDSLVGHSTVDNVKLTEKSLIVNNNWNPYLGQKPYGIGQVQQYAADFVVRFPLAGVTVSTELEANYAYFTNSYGDLNVPGARAQISAYYKPVEVALRYSAVGLQNSGFSYYAAPVAPATAGKLYSIVPNGMNLMQELALAFTWYLRTNLKGILDLSLAEVPVSQEKNVGAYTAAQQPDQVKVIAAGGTIERQTVKEARVMIQYWF